MKLCPLYALALIAWVVPHAPAQPTTKPLRIGVSPSMVMGLSVAQMKILNEDFPTLIKEFTGLEGTLVTAKSSAELARQIADGESPLGIFQGIEFAWAQEKYPDIKPLLLSYYRKDAYQAVAVVKKDSPVQDVKALQGKPIHWMMQGKEHVRLFGDKIAQGDSKAFFGNVLAASDVETALDSILLGKASAAIVDEGALDVYRSVNPGRFNRLREIGKSERFPPGVIAYHPKHLDAKVQEQFRAGMLKANQTDRGREVMSNFKITAFEVVPADFDTWLATIRKSYPAK